MLPTMFIGHGAGPFPLLGVPHQAALVETWAPGRLVHTVLHDDAVRAVVVISAHYESSEGAVEVMTDANPALLFDYGGFPPETYAYTLPNPGSPTVAGRVVDLLTAAGIRANGRSGRGHDHGTFVPLLGLGLATTRPRLPVVSISLRGPAHYRDGLTEDHWAMGHALQALRAEGVLLLGSGNTIHGRCTAPQAKAFDDHLQGLASEGPRAFTRWADHPTVRVCHPRPEHLVPLLVCAGAASKATVTSIQHPMMGLATSHFVFRD